jgi:prophage regulatory protein
MLDRILRRPEVSAATGLARSTLYLRISQKLFPRPIRLGPRMSGWLTSEVSVITSAYVRGAGDEEIRSLVARLETARKSAA